MPSSVGAYPDFSYCNGIRTGYFHCFFYAYDWPTVANVNLSFFSAFIEAFRSLGFYARTHAYVLGLRPSRKHHFLQVNISILNISFIKSIYIISLCVLLNPVTKSLAYFK